MNEQLRLVQIMEDRLEQAYTTLAEVEGIDEDTALDILRNSPSFMQQLQKISKKPKKIKRKKKKKSVKRKPYIKSIHFDQPDPYEYYPGHPEYMPPATTKDVYNSQMGQNMAPIIHNLAKRIAKDRNLDEPNYRVLEAQMKKLDWSYLAYEAKELGPKPPKHKLIRVFTKLFRPINKLADKIPLKYLMLILTIVQVSYLVWVTFYQYTEGMADQAARGVSKLHKKSLKRTRLKNYKKLGL